MKRIVICLLLAVSMAAHSQEKFIFTPQWTAQAQFAGYYVALEKGFYKQKKLGPHNLPGEGPQREEKTEEGEENKENEQNEEIQE